MKVEVEAGDVFDEFNFKQRGLKVGLQKDDICIPNQYSLFTSKNRQNRLTLVVSRFFYF